MGSVSGCDADGFEFESLSLCFSSVFFCNFFSQRVTVSDHRPFINMFRKLFSQRVTVADSGFVE